MCLGIPGQIVSITENQLAVVDFSGVRREVSLMLCPELRVGDYCLVHVGFAMQRLDPDEAQETLKLLDEFLEASGESS